MIYNKMTELRNFTNTLLIIVLNAQRDVEKTWYINTGCKWQVNLHVIQIINQYGVPDGIHYSIFIVLLSAIQFASLMWCAKQWIGKDLKHG